MVLDILSGAVFFIFILSLAKRVFKDQVEHFREKLIKRATKAKNRLLKKLYLTLLSLYNKLTFYKENTEEQSQLPAKDVPLEEEEKPDDQDFSSNKIEDKILKIKNSNLISGLSVLSKLNSLPSFDRFSTIKFNKLSTGKSNNSNNSNGSDSIKIRAQTYESNRNYVFATPIEIPEPCSVIPNEAGSISHNNQGEQSINQFLANSPMSSFSIHMSPSAKDNTPNSSSPWKLFHRVPASLTESDTTMEKIKPNSPNDSLIYTASKRKRPDHDISEF